jgi:cytochrome P450
VSRPPALPPGPSAPAYWQLLRYTHSPLPFLEGCARRHGDAFTVRLAGYGTLVFLCSPDAVRDVFRGDPDTLHSGEGNAFLGASVGRNSVLVLDGEPHARQRRVLLPPLKGERMRAFFGAMRAATLEAASAWPVGRPASVLESTRRITLRVILRAVLGPTLETLLVNLERKVSRVLEHGRQCMALVLMKLVPIRLLQRSRWSPFFRQLHDLDDVLFPIIRSRRASAAGHGEGILADLLGAAHADGTPLDDQEVRDAVVTLLFAGHETTALALAWALEQILPRADVMARLAGELGRVTGGGPPGAEHLDQLVYLDAAIREGLRVRTILPFVARLTKRPFAAGGREYPAGVILCPCNHLVHRRPDLYPEPEKFRPERFLERRYAGHEWFPFGGGNRTCLGMAFALYEMKVVLGTLLASVRLTRPPGGRSLPIRRGLALAPDDGVRVVVTGPAVRVGAGDSDGMGDRRRSAGAHQSIAGGKNSAISPS